MPNNKTPGNDGLSKEFYEAFWNELKDPLLKSFYHAKTYKEFSTSQRQAVVKLLEKKDRDKRLIKNWRPISLLNTDLKIFSKALAAKLKSVLPSLITSQQTAYVQNRYIGEGGRLISDILDLSDKLNVDGYLVAVDSHDHEFLLVVLKKIDFGNSSIDWIKILLTNQESCVINGGSTTSYFKLEKGARQGDPISAYLFIIALEIIFAMIKSNPNIKGLNIFNYNYLYTAYADDTTFFLNDQKSIRELMKTFKLFSKFSDLKSNILKCELAGIGSLKGV